MLLCKLKTVRIFLLQLRKQQDGCHIFPFKGFWKNLFLLKIIIKFLLSYCQVTWLLRWYFFHFFFSLKSLRHNAVFLVESIVRSIWKAHHHFFVLHNKTEKNGRKQIRELLLVSDIGLVDNNLYTKTSDIVITPKEVWKNHDS